MCLASAARVVTAENEARVLDVVRACTPRQAQRVLAAYRSLRPTTNDTPTVTVAAVMVLLADDLELDHWWRNWIDDHGRYRIDGALDKLTGELLEQARRAVIAEMERTGTHPHADEPSDAGEPSDTAEATDVGKPAGAADHRRSWSRRGAGCRGGM